MNRSRYTLSILIVMLCSITRLSAQYYNWGSDPTAQRWRTLQGESARVIYPEKAEDIAQQTMHYIDTLQSHISYGFKHQALNLPFVVHPDNFSSNGLVMWMPKRVDMLSTPDINGFSTLWLKHLVAHEYRHAAQYNNINKGLIKWLSYLLGEQGNAVGLALVPLYSIEGDAVKFETDAVTFGRALQPSFTMEYRAAADGLLNGESNDRWFSGSYRENIPDHYKLGYQITNYAYDKYGENIWDRVYDYSARKPYLISPAYFALQKFYNTSSEQLFNETFANLKSHWASLPKVEPSTEIVSEIDSSNYTTYAYPLTLDNGTVVALKSDYDTPSRFISFNPQSGKEQRLKYTGIVSSRPAEAANRIWWSEYRRSPLFAQDVNSVIRYMDIDTKRIKRLPNINDALYPTPIGDQTENIAYVEYAASGNYSIVELENLKESRRTELPSQIEVHGLAWDNSTEALYLIITDHDGMWIGKLEADGTIAQITKPSFTTLNDLRAKNGKLYFSSIASGYDEAHSLDLADGSEQRVTASTYGSFQPSTPSENDIYMTTYDKYGYHLAKQSAAHTEGEIKHSTTPANIVNPKLKRYDIINLDSVRFSATDSTTLATKSSSKRYHRSLHAVNIHSWMPVKINPYSIIEEQVFDVGLGVTLLSQNELSNLDGFVAYGWDVNDGSTLSTQWNYTGLGAVIGVGAEYGGDQLYYSMQQYNPETQETISQPKYEPKRYSSVTLSSTLPIYLQRGYFTHYIGVSAGWNYSNGMVAKVSDMTFASPENPLITNLETLGYNKGLQKLTMGVNYSLYSRSAYRNIATPKGIALSANYAINPTNRDFSDLLVLTSRLYFPGFWKNHSLRLSAGYQNSIGGYRYNDYSLLQYQSAALIPKGYTSQMVNNQNLALASVNYQLPLCYPDWGLWRKIYFKRISLGVGADYASYQIPSASRETIYSYGGDMTFDVNFLRGPAASSSSVKLTLYRTKDQRFHFSFGVGLPI